jgi:hypothetical protein
MAIGESAEANGRKRERDGEDGAAAAKKARVEAPAEDEGPKRFVLSLFVSFLLESKLTLI